MSRVRVTRRWRVNCDATLQMPMSAARTWGQLRDFERYACADPFHVDLKMDGNIPRAGAALTLYHQYIGIRIRRIGRILIWRGSQFSVQRSLAERPAPRLPACDELPGVSS